MIDAKASKAMIVVPKVNGVNDQGLRSLDRREVCRESAILSVSIAPFEGRLITVDSVGRPFSICPLRDSVGFQFVLLGRRLLVVGGLLSQLFRRSNSDCECWGLVCREVD